jgi:hypothetical protein
MAIRTFGPQTLTGVAQPIIGDVTTAAVVAAPHDVPALITVANTAIYQPDDRIVLEPLTTNSDAYRVFNILSSTVLQCWPESVPKAHASGVIVQLSIACNDAVVTPVDGGTGAVFIGSDNTITNVPAGNVIDRLDKTAAGTQANGWHMGGGVGSNSFQTADAWMVGTAGDKVYSYAVVI